MISYVHVSCTVFTPRLRISRAIKNSGINFRSFSNRTGTYPYHALYAHKSHTLHTPYFSRVYRKRSFQSGFSVHNNSDHYHDYQHTNATHFTTSTHCRVNGILAARFMIKGQFGKTVRGGSPPGFLRSPPCSPFRLSRKLHTQH